MNTILIISQHDLRLQLDRIPRKASHQQPLSGSADAHQLFHPTSGHSTVARRRSYRRTVRSLRVTSSGRQLQCRQRHLNKAVPLATRPLIAPNIADSIADDNVVKSPEPRIVCIAAHTLSSQRLRSEQQHEERGVRDLFDHPKRKERRGSKPRCHLLTYGSARDVAARLTSLVAPSSLARTSRRCLCSRARIEGGLDGQPRPFIGDL
jgi:hypothetical protein